MATQSQDFGGIIRSVYDPPTQSLNVNIQGSGSLTLPNVARLSDGTKFITTTNVGSKTALDVNITNGIDIILTDTVDSVAIGNGSGTKLAINPDGSINVASSGSSTVSGTVTSVTAGLNNFLTSQYAVSTSVVQITPTPLAGRSSISIRVSAIGNNAVYIGNNGSVSTTTGYPMFNGDTLQMDLTTVNSIYAISNAAGQTLFALEIA